MKRIFLASILSLLIVNLITLAVVFIPSILFLELLEPPGGWGLEGLAVVWIVLLFLPFGVMAGILVSSAIIRKFLNIKYLTVSIVQLLVIILASFATSTISGLVVPNNTLGDYISWGIYVATYTATFILAIARFGKVEN